MIYAHITDGIIDAVGRLPKGADADGQWLEPLTDVNAHLAGWFPVTDTPRPADTATTTFDRSVVLVAGVPTVTWAERLKTQAELDSEVAAAESTVRRTDLQASVSVLRQWADDAAATTVTAGNIAAVTQTMVNRLGIFFDRFADSVIEQFGQG
jgi:hypothetical protein